MKYFVYILRSLTQNKTYVGITNDIKRRLQEHNSGKTIFTRKFIPWEVIHIEEAADRLRARQREKYYKSAAGRKRIKLLLSNLSPRSSVDRAEVS